MAQVRQKLAPTIYSCLLACHQIPLQQLQVLLEVLQSLFRHQQTCHYHLALRYLELLDHLYLDNLLQCSLIQQASLGGLLFLLLLLCSKQHHQLQIQVLFHKILNHHFTHPIQDMVMSHLNLHGDTPILRDLLGFSSLPSSPILVL